MPDIVRRHPRSDFAATAEDIHPVLARVFANRGVADRQTLDHSVERLLPLQNFAGLEAAARLLAECVCRDRSILIVGDFDADGATATAVAMSALRAMGATRLDFLVPNRFEFGYGLTPELVAVALASRPELIVTVDNGIASIAGVAAARAQGIQTLITDHHLPGPQLPEADVIVNPNQHGCAFASKHLAGVGVIFYVMMALRQELRRRGWFADTDRCEPNLADLLDLVALGTVADVVPLDQNNRVLVQQGLLRIRAGRCRPGIKALLAAGSRDLSRVVAADLGFVVGPRLNAAGRLDDMSIGISCLLAADEHSAHWYAAQLDTLNRDRQQIEKGMQEEALALLDELLDDRQGELPAALCLYDARWHQGVVGIIAARLKERVHRPVFAFAPGEGGLLRGSARSITGVHVRDVLARIDSGHPGLITRFGGHAMAAGLSLAEADLEHFQQALQATMPDFLDGVSLRAEIASDGELQPADFELPLAQLLRYAGPWGQHFPEPVFDGVFELLEQRIVGQRHLKLLLRQPQPDAPPLAAIAFNIDTGFWPNAQVEQVRAAYRLDCNYFRGQDQLQLLVEYLEPVSETAPQQRVGNKQR